MQPDIKEPEGKVKLAEEGAGPQGLEITAKDKTYISGLVKMVHSPKTSGKILEMLKTAPPDKSVAQAALTMNSQMSTMAKQKGQSIPFETAIKGIITVSQELFNVGQTAGLFEVDQTEGGQIIQDTLSKFVHQGIKDKTIDPIEIQMYAESLMTDEQRSEGYAAAEQGGLPTKPGVQQAMETYASERESQAVNKAAERQAGQNKQGMMQGIQQQQGGA